MSIKSKLCSLGMTVIVFSFTTLSSWAATVCTTKTTGSGTNIATIAVASNFYSPAQDLVYNFQQTPAGANTAITICNNSTTALKTEIDNGANYSLFFAADTTAADYNNSSRTAYSYAKGVPVFFAYRTNISDISGLITGLSGYGTTLTANNLSSYAVNTSSAQSVAVASTDAPYGVKAHSIINSIEGTSLPGTIPSWVHSPLYSNINLTFSAVGSGGINSGFVSKAQICNILSSVVYVAFTGSDYVLDQKAILLNSSNTVASNLNAYLQDQIDSGDWNTFLTNHCYGTL